MPLPAPSSADCISDTIEQLIGEGYDQDQAIAIAEDHCKATAMNKIVHKVGEQSSSDPFEFVMSTDSPDRMGDIVEQDWKLSEFRKNPIALYQHDSDQPIGTWSKLRIEGKRLIGKLNLAKEGTSDLIDTVRSLVEQRILRAVSVGFRPAKAEPLDEKDPWGGYRLSGNSLLECSLVSVPANAEALSLAKSLKPQLRDLLVATDEPGDVPACKQLGCSPPSRDSDPSKTQPKPKSRITTMSLSEKIIAKREALEDLQNELTALTAEIDDGDLTEDVSTKMDELNARIDKAADDLTRLETAEASVKRSLDAQREKREQRKTDKTPTGAPDGIQLMQNKPKGFAVSAAISTMVKSFIEQSNPVESSKSLFKDNPEVGILIKAATDPATMTDAAWAAPLVRETWSEFLELIRDMSVYPQVPGMRLEFGAYGKINLPLNAGRGALAGGFVAEGAPIPVKEGAYGSTDLTPKKMAIITSFTREIAMHSMPAIQGLVQTQMLADTAEALDTLFLDANARDTTRPAGLQDTTETGAGNINAATGNTVAAILADTEGMITRWMTARTGGSAVWIMNPVHLIQLGNIQDAASGEFVFRQELNAGTFMGYPVVRSQNVPLNLLVLVGTGAMAFGNDFAPMIEVSRETTLVYDDTAPDHVLPDTNTMPAKSMFQMDGVAVKLRMGLDWRIIRQGGVQVLTGFLA